MWPVLERELRSASRKQTTYSLRLIGGVVAIAAIASHTVLQAGPSEGRELFDALYRYLFLAVWVLVPLAAADCISGERREGTLALLLLTPIRSWHIILAKSLSQILRLLGFGFAALPALAIPFLLGGVKWWEGVLCLLILASCFCWALAATLLVSSRSVLWSRANTGSLLVSLWFMVVFSCLFLLLSLIAFSGPTAWSGLSSWWSGSLWRFALLSLAATISLINLLGQGVLAMKSAPGTVILLGVSMLGLSVLALFASLFAAGWRLGARAKDSAARVAGPIENVFCRPFLFQTFYRRWLRARLESNPIGWLEQRTWSARVMRWCTLGFLMIAYSVLVVEGLRWRTITNAQVTIGFSVLLATAFAAAASFRRERENGVLPLLLTAPLTVSEIVRGRLLAIWGQFFLASALVILMWFGLNSISRRPLEFHHWVWFLSISFFTVPIVGLFYSLRRTSFLAAYSWTILVAVMLPLAIGAAPIALGSVLSHFESSNSVAAASQFVLTHALSWGDTFWFFPACLGGVAQIAIGIIALKRLYTCLSERTFALDRY